MKKHYAYLTKLWVLATMIAAGAFQLQAQDCKTYFDFLNQTNTTIASESGGAYRFQLKNESNQEITYKLSVKDLTLEDTENSCTITAFWLEDFYLNEIPGTIENEEKVYYLTLTAGEEKIFYVNLTVVNTENAKNMAKVMLQATDCNLLFEKTLETTFIAGE